MLKTVKALGLAPKMILGWFIGTWFFAASLSLVYWSLTANQTVLEEGRRTGNLCERD